MDKDTGNPVVHKGEGAARDNGAVGFPSVMKENDQYRMWYSGSSAVFLEKIGYANSSDGLTWKKNPDPVMGLFNGETAIWDGNVIKSPEDHYYMWYTEGPWESIKIRYAYSIDGFNWTQKAGNKAIENGESGALDKLLGFPSVLYDEVTKTYKMWYYGSLGFGIGYAEALNPEPTDVQELDIIPAEFILSQNYPNPFNPTTTIKFSIPAYSELAYSDQSKARPGEAERSRVKMIIYDLLGKEVAILVNKPQRPGNYEVKWDATGQASGVYFYKLTSDSFSETKKMLLLK